MSRLLFFDILRFNQKTERERNNLKLFEWRLETREAKKLSK